MHQTQFHSLNSRLLLPPRFNRISPSSSSSITQSPWINPSNFNARHFVINRRTWEARSLRKVVQNVAASSLPFACVSYSAPPVDNSVISQALIQLKDKHVRVLSCKLGKMFVGRWKKLQHAKDNAVADREQDSSNERNQTGSSLDFYKGYDDVVNNWISDYTNAMESNAKLKLESYMHKKKLYRSIITFLFTYVLAAIILF